MKTTKLQIDIETEYTRIIRDILMVYVRAEIPYGQIFFSPNLDHSGVVMTIANVTEENIESILVALDNSPIIKSWSVLSYI